MSDPKHMIKINDCDWHKQKAKDMMAFNCLTSLISINDKNNITGTESGIKLAWSPKEQTLIF